MNTLKEKLSPVLPHSEINWSMRERWVYSSIVLVLTFLLLIKVFLVPPTQDEVTSFFDSIVGSWFRMFEFNTPNNHFLNSFLGKLCVTAFGNNMTAFRLANFFSFPLFAFFLWRLSSSFSIIQRWSFCLGLLCCYPVFEYFGLARGYGLSFMLLVASIYYSVKAFESRLIRYVWLACIFCALSITANVALLNISLVILACMIYLIIKIRTNVRDIFPLALLVITISAFALVGIQNSGQIKHFFNEQNGFIGTTVFSLLNMLRYETNYLAITLLIIPVVISLGMNIYHTYVVQRGYFNTLFWLAFILFTSAILSSYILNWLLGIGFPQVRVGLYFIPLYFILVFAWPSYPKIMSSYIKPLFLGPAVVISLFCFFGFVANYKTYFSDVEPFAHLRQEHFDQILNNHKKSHATAPPIVSGNQALDHAWRYYNFRTGGFLNPYLTDTTFLHEFEIAELGDRKSILNKPGLTTTMLTHKRHQKSKGDYLSIVSENYHNASPRKIATSFDLRHKQGAKLAIYTTLNNESNERVYSKMYFIDQALVLDSYHVSLSWVLPPCLNCQLSTFIHNVEQAKLTIE